MNRYKLSAWQFSFLVSIPIFSFFYGLGTYYLILFSGNLSYLSIIIAFILGIILSFLFFVIFNFCSDKNILEKNKFLFGNFIGTILNCFLSIFIFIIGIFLLCDLSFFVVQEYLNQTPIWLFMIGIGLIISFNVSKGIVNIARVAVVFLLIFFLISIINILGIVPYFKFNNLKPLFSFNHHSITGGFGFLIIDILPLFLLLIINKEQIHSQKKLTKKMFFLYSLSFGIIFLENLLMLGTLGIRLASLYQYPGFIALQKISLFHFVNRIENFIYLKWILSTVICLSLIVYHVGSFASFVNISIRPYFIMFLMILFSFVYNNIIYYYSYSVQLLPCIGIMLFFCYLFTGIFIFIKKKIVY